MKVVKLENKKLTEEELRSNQNMHKPEDVQAVADVVYGDAMEFDEKVQDNAEEVYDALEKDASSVTPKDPDTGEVKIPKNMYAEKIALDESLFTEDADDGTVDSEVAEFLEDNVAEEDEGCATYKLDDRLGICVGWQDGYDSNDESIIHSDSDPTYAIVAGIKVYTSDDMRTDYDWINYPYFANGEVVDVSVAISPDENYDELAGYFLKEYSTMADWEIEEDGLVIKSDNGEEDAVEESLDYEPMVSPNEWAAYKGVSVIDDDEIVGLDIFNVRDKLGRWYTLDSQSVGIAGGVYNFRRPGFGQFSNVTLVTDRNGVVSEVKGVVFSDEKVEESISHDKSLTEKKGKVEGEDDTVYQLVYDALFLGNKNFRPHIADEAGSVYDWEQSLIMLPGYNDYDLGIALEKEEDGKYAKAVADKLGLKYEIKPTSSLSDGYKFIATVRIPDDIANKDATEYVTSIGLDMNTIRPKKTKKK